MGIAYNTNGEERNSYMTLVENQKEGNHWEDQDVGG
jgi:hypothetical protein